MLDIANLMRSKNFNFLRIIYNTSWSTPHFPPKSIPSVDICIASSWTRVKDSESLCDSFLPVEGQFRPRKKTPLHFCTKPLLQLPYPSESLHIQSEQYHGTRIYVCLPSTTSPHKKSALFFFFSRFFITKTEKVCTGIARRQNEWVRSR